MTSPVASIIRKSIRKDGEPYNILTFPTHERYETGLAQTGHNFYAFRAQGIKDWNDKYGKCPDNYILLDSKKEWSQLLLDVDFDFILSQNKFGQFQYALELSKRLHLPIVSLEHTLPFPGWPEKRLTDCQQMRGDFNVFISNYSIGKWGWQEQNDTYVIKHMVDTDVFNPGWEHTIGDIGPRKLHRATEQKNHILSVVNDWINREWCCNFSGWRRITNGLPVRVLGDTKGLSETAKSIDDLVNEYRSSRIFINTSTISPVPTALLEAMACGCAVVSTATCMIPEVIENGVNGFLSNDENELREYCVRLLNDEDLAKRLGYMAKETILNKFNKDRFLSEWNHVFNLAANKGYCL